MPIIGKKHRRIYPGKVETTAGGPVRQGKWNAIAKGACNEHSPPPDGTFRWKITGAEVRTLLFLPIF
jgi:hypothetical protein